MMVLSYQAFGPQVTATEVLGNEWWQWQAHGDSRPRDYDVKVVVYRGISLIDVKAAYPVIEEKHQDYRYLPYAKAMAYLDDKIAEKAQPSVTEKLTATREQLSRYFDDQRAE